MQRSFLYVGRLSMRATTVVESLASPAEHGLTRPLLHRCQALHSQAYRSSRRIDSARSLQATEYFEPASLAVDIAGLDGFFDIGYETPA